MATRKRAPQSKAEVSARQRAEWEEFRATYFASGPITDPELARQAKAMADILKISQEAERKAWGFADGEGDVSLEIDFECGE